MCFEAIKENEEKMDKKSRIDQAKEKFQTPEEVELKAVLKPTVIKFPKFTKPICSVSCGADHVLALTIDKEMYSWGSNSYGALGFGEDNSQSQKEPRLLPIKDYKNSISRISQICCGKYHSLCLTTRQEIYTWGHGKSGRLGHGGSIAQDPDADDEKVPKEIYTLSQRKPIFLSAGESHSAAITEKQDLFTWGNGGFGRLGHTEVVNVYTPK